MTITAKNILINSIGVFKTATREEKSRYIQTVQKNLNDHKNAIDRIGIGYAEHVVQAGEIFLRIYKK